MQPETKWIISRMSLLAGARTHATISALSSCVPTLSFGYSIKARGINRDIFEHEDYCLSPDQVTPDRVASKIKDMLLKKDPIITELNKKIPVVQKKAMHAGELLNDLVGQQ